MIETALNGARRPRKFCPVVVWCSPPCVCRTSCVSYVVCVARRVCRPSCVVVRRAFWVSSFVVSYVVCFLMYSPHFSRTSWASGLFTSFWSPFAFDLSYAPARLCTSAGVPRSTRAGRGFPLGVYISLAAWWSFSFARAVLVFLRVVHWGGPFPSSVRGASSLVHWGGPISCLTRTRSSERRFVCLLFIAALLSLGCLMSELGTAGQAMCFRRLSIEDPRSFVPSHSTPHRAYFERSCATRRCVD